MKLLHILVVCCAGLMISTGCARLRTMRSLSPEQVAARKSAFNRGLMPHESLWTSSEYEAYWDGHSNGYDDLYEPTSYSPTRYINEYSKDTHFFYRNGYSKGWSEAKAEAIADGEYRPRSSGGSSRSSKSRSRPAPSTSAPKSDPAPSSSGSGSGGSGGLIIPRRF